MTAPREERPEGRDVDAEFSRMLADEGLVVGPGEAPREPAAEDPARLDEDEDPWEGGTDDAPAVTSEESRARARAAHPSAGARPAPGDREAEDEEEAALLGDFVPPDPDLAPTSSPMLWSWTALVGGLVLLLVATVSATLPAWLGGLGGLIAVGGLIALLLQVPTRRKGDDEGIEL
ncbi:hypothetical protein NLU66_12875 [Brachybacterium sp. NBEC-018]|uniref:hypothetical protein n=1 Tax=Brachybacterium sp. NBEC-018 TaxID=2996004 RepID=UPI00217543F2|nr:hypothetical protein [Brachybacterium sp. NBEC-018]UVY83111.1 hypothetical protein NLU66_12875 [Brachybacterium sp. NBEC-018]